MEINNQNIEYNFVAFIDLLGFSNMVRHDLESPTNSDMYINKLYNIHLKTLELNNDGIQLELVQFSDSIVLATKFDKNNFNEFLNKIAKFQYELFNEGILCRGGIALGKHFYNNGFMFSLGLIEAYKIETSVAKFPRTIVSSDLIDLLYGNEIPDTDLPLIKEYDGLYFVDYFKFANSSNLSRHNSFISKNIKSTNPSVKEKYIWLADYFNHKFSESSIEISRFI